ncbi:MAG TPA: dihydrolipoamide acetyltransferase family protein [Kofleriaceae bacterium]|nr:dihydrolipoamide acetyltransferase family protein [Kofleriaceae bacterium]
MAFEFHLPDIGEGVIEGEIVKWCVAEGDRIELDQPLVEIMTDKATVEIPAPRSGTIQSIRFAEGEICPVGDVLVVIADGVADAPAATPIPARIDPDSTVPIARAATGGENGVAAAARLVEAAPVARGRVLATPATRRLARKLGVDLATVTATGKRGRITTDDVRSHVDRPAARQPSFAPVAISEAPALEERIPFRGLRKRIADNMSRATHTASHFTYVEEIDVTDLVEVRTRARARAEDRGLKLTYLPFIIKAIVAGLKKWPQLNAALDETTQEIVRKRYYHIGIAAQGPQGLMVTVVRDADKRSIFDLAAEIARLARAVEDGTATRDDLSGSTFTITSLGKLGGVLATPIINFPEVGIVGIHKIAERPAVRDGAIVVRSLMNLSISLDHRLVDGWDGAMFLQDVKTLLEDPTLMFLEMV